MAARVFCVSAVLGLSLALLDGVALQGTLLLAAIAATAVTRFDTTDPSVDVPDHVLATLEFADEVTATIEMSARTQAIASNTATIFGSEGTIEIDVAGQRIRRAPAGRTDWADVEVRDEDRADWTAEIDFVELQYERAVEHLRAEHVRGLVDVDGPDDEHVLGYCDPPRYILLFFHLSLFLFCISLCPLPLLRFLLILNLWFGLNFF